MSAFRNCAVVLVCVAIASWVSAAEDKSAGKAAGAGFDKIKSLSGEWETTRGPEGHGPHSGTVTYKVTAGGSAVLETLFGGTEHEMVTLYYMDGDSLALTHYCMLQNRPHMRAEPQSSPDAITFKCQNGDKIEAEDHMHQVTFTFVDPDHVKTAWVLYKDGKPAGTHAFELVRKKK